jgi:hypothetical protein
MRPPSAIRPARTRSAEISHAKRGRGLDLDWVLINFAAIPQLSYENLWANSAQ